MHSWDHEDDRRTPVAHHRQTKDTDLRDTPDWDVPGEAGPAGTPGQGGCGTGGGSVILHTGPASQPTATGGTW